MRHGCLHGRVVRRGSRILPFGTGLDEPQKRDVLRDRAAEDEAILWGGKLGSSGAEVEGNRGGGPGGLGLENLTGIGGGRVSRGGGRQELWIGASRVVESPPVTMFRGKESFRLALAC